MRRILLGVTTSLAIWFGSALAAEAQQITPTGPLAVMASDPGTTYTATCVYPTCMNFTVKVQVLKNGATLHTSSTIIPNPGTTTYYFSKAIDFAGWGLTAGDTLVFKAQLLYSRVTYYAADWKVVVTGTRPTSTITSIGKSSKLALQSIERDRRRE
jgi:hypothetical protein